MIFVVVKMRVRHELADDFPERVRAFTEATRAEEGNLWYDWSRSVEDPDQYVLVEGFRDAEAGARHVGSDHFKAAMSQLAELVSEVPDIVRAEVPGSSWLKMQLAPVGVDRESD